MLCFVYDKLIITYPQYSVQDRLRMGYMSEY